MHDFGPVCPVKITVFINCSFPMEKSTEKSLVLFHELPKSGESNGAGRETKR